MEAHNSKQKGSLLLYSLGFILFLEWLRPLTEITDTGNLNLFIMFTAYTFFISYMQLPIIIAFPVRVIMVLYIVHVLFYTSPLLEKEWLLHFFLVLKENFILCLALDFTSITPPFRTFLFLIVLWLVSYLMYYWLIQIRKITLFFILTIIFITVVDTFTMYDATNAIFRSLALGFILLGVLHILRMQEREGLFINKTKIFRSWIGILAILLFFSTSVAHALPKYNPMWPDPIEFITSYSEKAIEETVGGSIVKKSGYGENDSRLGGPFTFDKSPLFTAEMKELHYWRVESKDMYTGRGWESTGENVTYKLDPSEINFPLYDPTVETLKLKTEITLSKNKDFEYILNPGQVQSISTEYAANYQYEERKQRIKILSPNGKRYSIPSYGLSYEFPKFSIKQLKSSTQNYPAAISEKYLQLPAELPERVKTLTEEIVQGIDNPYERALAIEDYFGKEKFFYETKSVPVPGKNQDYVDQFLFDSKRGYCDNYSTSMAVMLRTIGIPSRWVKGFTQGKYKETLTEGVRRYTVSNANAHSWVEAYFPGVGWVPFEPTRGFSNLYDFVDDEETEDTPEEEQDEPRKKRDKEEEPEEDEEPAPKEDETTGGGTSNNGENLLNSTISKIFGTFLFIGALIAAYVLVTRRNKLYIKYLLFRFKHRKDDQAFYEAYRKLILAFDRCGYTRDETKTLREYATYIDERLKTKQMTELTLLYEHGVYYKGQENVWHKMMPTWKELLTKLELRA